METQDEFIIGHKPYLYIKLYAEVESENEANLLAEDLLPKLENCAPVALRSVLPYWKIPAYYGFLFDFAPHGTYRDTFNCLVALSLKGWSFSGSLPGREAIWNPKEGAVFLHEAVRWVHVDLCWISLETSNE